MLTIQHITAKGPFGDPMRWPAVSKFEDKVEGVSWEAQQSGLGFQRPISLWRTGDIEMYTAYFLSSELLSHSCHSDIILTPILHAPSDIFISIPISTPQPTLQSRNHAPSFRTLSEPSRGSHLMHHTTLHSSLCMPQPL